MAAFFFAAAVAVAAAVAAAVEAAEGGAAMKRAQGASASAIRSPLRFLSLARGKLFYVCISFYRIHDFHFKLYLSLRLRFFPFATTFYSLHNLSPLLVSDGCPL